MAFKEKKKKKESIREIAQKRFKAISEEKMEYKCNQENR